MLIVFFLLIALNGINELITFFATPVLIDRGLDIVNMGWLLGIYAAGMLLAALPAGFASDRFSARLISRVGLFLLIVGLALLANSQTILLIAIGLLSSGIGWQTSILALEALFYRYLDSDQRSRVTAKLTAGRQLAFAAVVVGAGLIGSIFDLDFIFWIGAGLALLLILISFWLPDGEKFSCQFGDYSAQWSQPVVRRFLLFTAIFYSHGGVDAISCPHIWHDELHMSSAQLGILGGLGAAVIGAPLVLIFSKKIDSNSRLFAVAGFLLSGLGHYLLYWFSDFDFVLLARFVHLAGDSLLFLFFASELAWLYSKHTLGGQFGLVTVVALAIGIVSRIAIGLIGSEFGFRFTLLITSFIAFLAAIWVLLDRKLCKERF